MTEQMHEQYEKMYNLVEAGRLPEDAALQCGIAPNREDETGYDDDYSELMCRLAADYLNAQPNYHGDVHYLDYLRYRDSKRRPAD